MAAPTLVGTATTSSGASSSLNFVSGIVAGDRIYVVAYGAASSITSPAFTTYQSGLGNFSLPYAIYTRTATGSEGASAVITGSASVEYMMFVLRGVNATTQEEAFAITAANNTATYTIPSSTSTINDSLQISFCVDNQHASNTVTTAPASGTLVKLDQSAGALLTSATYFRTMTVAGAISATTLVWTTGAAYGDAFTFVARGPAAGGGGGPKFGGAKKRILMTMAGYK